MNYAEQDKSKTAIRALYSAGNEALRTGRDPAVAVRRTEIHFRIGRVYHALAARYSFYVA